MRIKIIFLTALVVILISLPFLLASSKDNALDIPPSKLLENLFSTDTVKQREAKEGIVKQRKDMINRLVEMASKKKKEDYLRFFADDKISDAEKQKEFGRICSHEDSIELLGELRAIEAIDVLIANIEFTNIVSRSIGSASSNPYGGFISALALTNIGGDPVAERCGGDLITGEIIQYLNQTSPEKVSDIAIELYAYVLGGLYKNNSKIIRTHLQMIITTDNIEPEAQNIKRLFAKIEEKYNQDKDK